MYKHFVFIILLAPFFSLCALIDLEKGQQEYVLEAKQLYIEEYPDAFNPCIFRWKEETFVSFRLRDPKTQKSNIIKIAKLNGNLDLVSPYYPVVFRHGLSTDDLVQDPRFIQVSDKLYVVYSNVYSEQGIGRRLVFTSEVVQKNNHFVAINPKPLLYFDGIAGNKFEKNWVPFSYQGQLLLSYTLNPHKVFIPLPNELSCETVGVSECLYSWIWGTLRGGTPAFIVDGEYLAFFHSSIRMLSAQSQGKAMTHYFMGAYTFSTEPPFELRKISPDVLVGPQFYSEPYHDTWKPLRVVFPCGFVYDDKFIWISYGRQDYEMWIVKLDKEKLLQSLVPVTPRK